LEGIMALQAMQRERPFHRARALFVSLVFSMMFSLMFSLAMASAPALAGGAPATSTGFLYEDARIYVPVRVGDLAPRWFILDTGATNTIVDTAVADAAHLHVGHARMVGGVGRGQSRQGDTGALELHVGTTPMVVAKPAVMDLAHLLGPTSGRAPAGIIGSQFFREHFVAIDFSTRTLTVRAPGDATPAEYVATVPLTFAEWTPLAHVALTLPGGRTVKADVLIDLGAKSTFLISEPFIERERLREAFPRAVTTGFGAGVGGDTYYAFARAQHLALADAPAVGMDGPVVGLSVGGTLRSAWHDGLLGAEFLARYRVGFDYAHQRLLLAPQGNPAPQFDRSGMFLVAAGPDLSEVVVRQVLKDGPADVAGLVPGDRILALDGTPAAALRLDGVRARLKEEARATVAISYRRGEETGRAQVRLRALL
jgi:hypothetical protein